MGSCLKKQASGPIKNLNPKVILNEETKKPLKVTDVYVLKKVIGQGAFGIVRRGSRIDNPSINVAIKTISKSKLHGDLNQLKNEVDILSAIDHPNIVRLYDFFDEEYFFHIVTEFCSGGELFEIIVKNGRITESMVARYMKKMLRAINHLHNKNICHRDLKPQNFLFSNEAADSELKLIDFGLAHRFSEDLYKQKMCMETFVGTPHFIAPEMLKGKYDKKCDIWSLGVIMCLMLTGTYPFTGSSNNEVFVSIVKEDLKFENHVFKHISPLGVEFLKSLLNKSPKERPTAEEALTMRWITLNKENLADRNIFRNLSIYKPPNAMYRATMAVLVKYMSSQELENLTAAFNEVDQEGNGFLSLKDIERSIKNSGVVMPKREINEIFKKLDFANDGVIHYSEFLSATVSMRLQLDEQMMWTLFNYFDIDKSGNITFENLKTVFKKQGLYYSDEKIRNILKEVDFENTGKISFEEFKSMLGHKAVI
jgi:calcium-dependent protein kinase